MSRDQDVDAEAVPLPVNWSEGMLLAPQHFQQHARHLDAASNFRLRAAVPFSWGVRRLKVEDRLLPEGVYRITALDVLMPDGLIASLEAESEGLEIEPAAMPDAEGGDAPTVHLCVDPHGDGSTERRYATDVTTDCVDENTGETREPVVRLRPRLRLELTKGPLDPPKETVSIPLDRLLKNGRSLERDPNFQRPVLAARTGDPIHQIGQEIWGELSNKSRELFGRLERGDLGASYDEGMDHIDPRRLVATIPRLDALLKSGQASPFDLYLTLCDSLATTAAAAGKYPPAIAASFTQDDAYPAYHAVRDLIFGLLKSVTPPFELIAMARGDDGAFRLPDGFRTTEDLLRLAVFPSRSSSSQELARWLDAAVIASEARLNAVTANRARGAARVMIDERGGGSEAPIGANEVRISRGDELPDAADRFAIRHPEGAVAAGEPSRIFLMIPRVASVAANEPA